MKATLQLSLLLLISFIILWYDKKQVTLEKSPEGEKKNNEQVILLLVDALREDFIEMEDSKRKLK